MIKTIFFFKLQSPKKESPVKHVKISPDKPEKTSPKKTSPSASEKASTPNPDKAAKPKVSPSKMVSTCISVKCCQDE